MPNYIYDGAKKWMDSWITSKYDEFLLKGIRELPEGWAKVAASDGQYFE